MREGDKLVTRRFRVVVATAALALGVAGTGSGSRQGSIDQRIAAFEQQASRYMKTKSTAAKQVAEHQAAAAAAA
jgi:hypothetical protein